MFVVRVADNFHYMDEDDIITHGSFETWTEAVAAAKGIVDRCLEESHQPGMTAEELFAHYTSFGEDAYISPVPAEEVFFSAWNYARERCAVMCDGSRVGRGAD